MDARDHHFGTILSQESWTLACQALTYSCMQNARLRDCIKGLEFRCGVLDAKRQMAEQQQLTEAERHRQAVRGRR